MIGNIYKIIVNCSNQIYIGSTFQECRARWQDHVKSYYEWKNKKRTKTTSFDLFDKYGIDNCKIILIRQYEVVDRNHLRALEQLWINKLQPVNSHSAFVIDPVLKKKLQEYNKKYYETNKGQILEYQKKYYETNKGQILEREKKNRTENNEKIIQRNKKYYEKNKPRLNEKCKKYRQENKDSLNQKKREKITCEICNSEITRAGKSQHEKSKKHQSNLTKQTFQ